MPPPKTRDCYGGVCGFRYARDTGTSATVDADGIAAAVVRVGVPRGEAVDEGEAGRGAVGVVLSQGDARRHRQVGLVQAESGDHETTWAQGRGQASDHRGLSAG